MWVYLFKVQVVWAILCLHMTVFLFLTPSPICHLILEVSKQSALLRYISWYPIHRPVCNLSLETNTLKLEGNWFWCVRPFNYLMNGIYQGPKMLYIWVPYNFGLSKIQTYSYVQAIGFFKTKLNTWFLAFLMRLRSQSPVTFNKNWIQFWVLCCFFFCFCF